MGQSVEIVAGQSAGLPAGSYLDARLTGASGGVRVSAVGRDGQDVSEPLQSDSDVTVRPGVGNGAFRLVAVPIDGGLFAPRTRIGLELRGGAGSSGDGPQILVGQSDVGAYSHIELAQVDYHQVSGWQVTAGGGREASVFDFLDEGSAPATALDERHYPWIGLGRYALRRARNGSSGASPSGQSWALVVDSSASMRRLFNEEALSAAIELVAGIVAELTGQLPVVAGLTGRNRPDWIEPAVKDPGTLAREVLSATQPASWTRLLPALTEAVGAGAQAVVFVLDGAPSDLEALLPFLEREPDVTVLIVVAARADPEVAGQSGDDQELELMSFDHLSHLTQLRFAHVSIGASVAASDASATVAAALAGATA